MPAFASAQDTLFLFHGKKQVVQIQSMNDSTLSYKNFYNLNGPLYNIPMRSVMKIGYLNGQTYINQSALNAVKENEKEQILNIGKKHHVSINAFDLLYETFTFQYMYMFRKNTLGIRIPVSIGAWNFNHFEPIEQNFGLKSAYYNKDKLYSTSVDFLIFPTKLKRVFRFYTGLSYEQGRFEYTTNIRGPYNIYQKTSKSQAIIVQLGILHRNSQHLHFSLGFGLGKFYQTISLQNLNGEFHRKENGVAVRLSLNIGYKFNL